MDTINLLLCKLLLIFLRLQSSWSQLGYYGTQVANKCFSVAGVPQLDFDKCQPDERILVLNAVQGIGKNLGQCTYRQGDCIETTTPDTDSKLRETCIGKPGCNIHVSVAWMEKCNAYSSYNYVLYQCIPADDIFDICSQSERGVFRSGYIQSPGFPDLYPSNQECHCNITTDPDQKILLNFADFHVEWSENCEKDVVRVADGTSRMPRCGRLPRNYNITSQTNQVQIYFRTDSWQQFKGFWLKAEALGHLKISCGPVAVYTTTTTTMAPPESSTPYDEKFFSTATEETNLIFATVPGFYFTTPPTLFTQANTEEQIRPDEPAAEPDRISSLVGIIVGCILAVIIIITIIFLIIFFKRRRHKEQISRAPEAQFTKTTRRDRSPRSRTATPSPSSTSSKLSDSRDSVQDPKSKRTKKV